MTVVSCCSTHLKLFSAFMHHHMCGIQFALPGQTQRLVGGASSCRSRPTDATENYSNTDLLVQTSMWMNHKQQSMFLVILDNHWMF